MTICIYFNLHLNNANGQTNKFVCPPSTVLAQHKSTFGLNLVFKSCIIQLYRDSKYNLPDNTDRSTVWLYSVDYWVGSVYMPALISTLDEKLFRNSDVVKPPSGLHNPPLNKLMELRNMLSR